MTSVQIPPFHHLPQYRSESAIMDLPGFDPSTMTYLATQMAHPGVPNPSDPFQDMLLPMDMHAQSQYGDNYTHAGSDDMTLHTIPHQTSPTLKRSYSAYEDPFSDVVSAFDNPMPQDTQDPDAPSIDRDNKLLSFSQPQFDYSLLDYTYRRTTISLSAQLHGMFFLAESPWAAGGDAQIPPSELTCYRRNLFQITGDITLPRSLRYIMTDQGEQIPIIAQELCISATESTEGNPVKIITVPWKTPANPTGAQPEDKVEREPTSIPLDLTNMHELDTDFASFPFQFKRLQFRIATANNGRRKELQQHFVVSLKVVATLATNIKIPICQVQSGAIIVRGRSPRNFQSRKDMPLNGTGNVRKSHLQGGTNRSSTGESASGRKQSVPEPHTSAPAKTEAQQPTVTMPSYFETQDQQQTTNDFYDWKGPSPVQPPHAATTVGAPLTSPLEKPNIYAVSSPDRRKAQKVSHPPSQAPINLSLVEDDSPRAESKTPPAGRTSKKLQIPARPPSFTLNTINSPDESADLLYEYFPLGMDDWTPPVDAVYRPHVVHHTKLPSDPRDPKTVKGAKSKRYFSEDVS